MVTQILAAFGFAILWAALAMVAGALLAALCWTCMVCGWSYETQPADAAAAKADGR
jgi:hypothetical protein